MDKLLFLMDDKRNKMKLSWKRHVLQIMEIYSRQECGVLFAFETDNARK
jgi:hypothetical protein